MNVLTKVDELIKMIEWQQGGKESDRTLKMTLGKKGDATYTLSSEEEKKEVTVQAYKEITLDKTKHQRVRKRDLNKVVSQVNGTIYPFSKWMNKGDRSVTLILRDEGLDIEVFDHLLGVGQTVQLLEQIDLYSEKILQIMHQITELDENDPERKGLLQEIVRLEQKKLK